MVDLKVDFIDDEHFIIYYLSEHQFRTEEEMKSFFKLLNYNLKCQYCYEFHGFYNVNIFCSNGIYVLDFENIDDYGSSDFNITMLLNSVLLYEFDDFELLPGEKVYYNGKFYVEVDSIIDNIYLFEYGNIIFDKKVEEVLNHGLLVSI